MSRNEVGRLLAISLGMAILGTALAVTAAYGIYARGVPKVCPQFTAPGIATTNWHEMYCGHAYLWAPRPPAEDQLLCSGDPAVRVRECIRLDDPSDPLQQKVQYFFPEPLGTAEWPWNGHYEGAIVFEDMPRWQQVLEVAACGDNYARWPRSCYEEFVPTLVGSIIGFVLAAWLMAFLGLVFVQQNLSGNRAV